MLSASSSFSRIPSGKNKPVLVSDGWSERAKSRHHTSTSDGTGHNLYRSARGTTHLAQPLAGSTPLLVCTITAHNRLVLITPQFGRFLPDATERYRSSPTQILHFIRASRLRLSGIPPATHSNLLQSQILQNPRLRRNTTPYPVSHIVLLLESITTSKLASQQSQILSASRRHSVWSNQLTSVSSTTSRS